MGQTISTLRQGSQTSSQTDRQAGRHGKTVKETDWQDRQYKRQTPDRQKISKLKKKTVMD